MLPGFMGSMMMAGGRFDPPAYLVGDRRGQIIVTVTVSAARTLSNIVDGMRAQQSADPEVTGASAGQQWRFDFGAGNRVLVTEATLYLEDSRNEGNWKWRGTDDLVSFVDIGSSFSISGSTIYTLTQLAGNAEAYRYYALEYISGNASGNPRWREIEFKQAER